MSPTTDDRRLVRGVAAEIDEAIEVELGDPDVDGQRCITLGKGGSVWETYDTAEEAITALRASWSP